MRKLLAPHAPVFVDKVKELLDHSDPRVQLEAVKIGMGYLWGKPKESIEHSGDGSGAFNVIIERSSEPKEPASGNVVDVRSQPAALPGSAESQAPLLATNGQPWRA